MAPMPLTEQQLEHLRKRLLEQRAALEGVADSSRAAGETVELDQTRQGRLSRMDALQQQAVAQASESRRVLQLKRIAGALQRIERGSYGNCARCGEAIALARLEADPAATLCIDCAE